MASPYHELAKKQFANRFGGVLTFQLVDKKARYHFMNKLKIIRRSTSLGDNTPLCIHPESTIFREYTPDQKKAMGVTEGLIRLSVGIETAGDLLSDLHQALE